MTQLPYWMEALTNQEREDLAGIQVKVLTEDVDITTIEGRALVLVTRLADLFNESEEIETVEALDGGSFDDGEFEEDED